MVAKIIIGANYGDEGKGLMTDYFCRQSSGKCLVVCTNGGAQRGHTVETPEGIRHVFHHFGSGTLAGADTYFSKNFILNPIVFRKEYDALGGHVGNVYAHSQCRITNPFDMITNQILEERRGDNKHGSCGMGIWETILRYDMGRGTDILENVRRWWMPIRTGDKIPEEWEDVIHSSDLLAHYRDDLNFMRSKIKWVNDDAEVLTHYPYVVFENGQGLLLDQKFGKHSTPTDTGCKYAMEILKNPQLHGADIEAVYVTRSYLTRHGAGPLDGEGDIEGVALDQTNTYNKFQGAIRYAQFDDEKVGGLINRVKEDAHQYLGGINRISLALTHANECDDVRLIGRARYISDDKTWKGVNINDESETLH